MRSCRLESYIVGPPLAGGLHRLACTGWPAPAGLHRLACLWVALLSTRYSCRWWSRPYIVGPPLAGGLHRLACTGWPAPAGLHRLACFLRVAWAAFHSG